MLKPNFVAIDDLVADGLERLADDIFVRVRAVHFGGIEERHATSTAARMIAMPSSRLRGRP